MRILLCLVCSAQFLCFAAQAQQVPQDSTQQIIPGRANSAQQQQKPYVIYISADGFRYDLADKYHAANLIALRAKGVAAAAMRPSYPSVTFPNHYTLATGLYPSHHGLVDNIFYDRKKGKGYRINDRTAVQDSSWYGGTPIWVLAEEQKMVSASFFWVGSEAAEDGVRPSYFYWFNDRIPIDTRLQVVKNWLLLPEAQRPHLILFYLSQVDHAEHLYGPDSKEAEAAVHLVDDCIGKMTRMVDSLHLPVNYVFVSDHGMAQTDTLHGLTLPTVIDTSKFIVSAGGTMVHLYAKDKNDIAPTLEALKRQSGAPGAAGIQSTTGDFRVYTPDQTPAAWHYTTADDRFGRIGDILLVANYPKVFVQPGRRILKGEHGYDPAIPEMGASFYAWGPAFQQGLTIPAFENVNVYPLIARILGLKITEPIDGSIKVLEGVLK
jgi:predicted AlkP superfamily pyrophosphatase or phosphodiesterase